MSDTMEIVTPKYRWRVAPRWADVLQDSLAGQVENSLDPEGSKEIKNNDRRRVLRIPHGATGLGALYLKTYKVVNFWHALHYLVFPTKCSIEWRNLEAYAARGVSVPVPAFMGEPKECFTRLPQFLALEAIENVRYPNEILLDPETDREKFIIAFARWTRSVFEAGTVMKDFNPGNVLVQTDGEAEWKFNLIDLTEAKIGKVTIDVEAEMLAKCLGQMSKWLEEPERKLFLQNYRAGRDTGPLVARMEKIFERQKMLARRKRSRRCLTNSSGIIVEKCRGWEVIRRREKPTRMKVFVKAAEEVTGEVRTDIPPDMPASAGEVVEIIEAAEPPQGYDLTPVDSVREAKRRWVLLHENNALGRPGPLAVALARSGGKAYILTAGGEE